MDRERGASGSSAGDEAGGNRDEGGDGSGSGPAGMLLSIALLDVMLFGMALWALSIGEAFVGGGIFLFALLLTGIDVWLYRRGSF